MPINPSLQKLLQLYKSGRYQCDVWFYDNLMQLIRQLEVFEFVPSLESNLSHVKKIHQLVEENSDSLNEEFDQDKATQKAEQIKKYIHLINTDDVSQIMSHLEKQQYVSYVYHAVGLTKKYNYHAKYIQILQNILNTVYDPQLRVQYVMVCTLFMLRNREKVEEILSIYDRAIQNGLGLMKTFRKNLPNIKKIMEIIMIKMHEIQASQQVHEPNMQQTLQKMKEALQHLRTYCHGVYFIYTTLLKLCDLVKILQQKTNFTLKLNSYKTDVEQILHQLNTQNPTSAENPHLAQEKMSYLPLKELKTMFLGQKNGVEKINRTCKICLRCVEKEQGQNSAPQYHKVCQEVVKQLLATKIENK